MTVRSNRSTKKIPREGRDSHGRFIPGRTGNPKGRTPVAAELKAMFMDLTPIAKERLRQLMFCDDPTVCVAACKAVLDRGLGRPEQASTLDVTLSQKPKMVYPAMVDMDASEATRVYQQLMDPNNNIEFLPPRQKTLTPINLWEEMMKPTPEEEALRAAGDALRLAEQQYNDALAGKYPSPAPNPLAVVRTTAERAIPAPRRPQEATAAGRALESPPVEQPAPEISHRRPLDSDGSAPPELAKETWAVPDWQDRTLVAVVEAAPAVTQDHPERDFHEHSAKADSPCRFCRQLWVNS